jgi:fructokinase
LTILVCGEALIDLTPDPDGRYTPCVGGGPLNVAVALARLEAPVAFLSRVSTDGFGRRIVSHLADNGVDLSCLVRAPEPTTLAVVTTDETGSADYQFYVEGTADRQLAPADLPAVTGFSALHVTGSLCLTLEPSATTVESLLRSARGVLPISFDPNVRPPMIASRSAYLERFAGWLSCVDIVKASAEDIGWLYPGRPVADVVKDWLTLGPSVVVVTLGAHGALLATAGALVERATPAVPVVDTVGAGDTVSAALLGWLHAHDRLDRASLAALGPEDAGDMLQFAVTAAAATCARKGADPPRLADVEAALSAAASTID